MDYCGIEFTAVQSADSSSWKWQLSASDNHALKSCGEAASQRSAINEAHEAIGASLRANTSPDHASSTPRLVGGILHILHGARGHPPTKAVEALRPFLSMMRNTLPGADRLADEAAFAVGTLVNRLETHGTASDDLWEVAIEASLSFANERAAAVKS